MNCQQNQTRFKDMPYIYKIKNQMKLSIIVSLRLKPLSSNHENQLIELNDLSLFSFDSIEIKYLRMPPFYEIKEELGLHLLYSKGLMLIIFQPNVNKNPRAPWILLTVLLTVIGQAYTQIPTQLNFTTPFTQCEMIFDINPTPPSQKSPSKQMYQLKSCQMSRCATLGSGSTCKQYTTIKLEESSCFEYCCRTTTFDKNACLQNNHILREKSEKMDSYVIMILAVCSLCLIIIILFFLTNDLKFFERKPDLPPMEKAPTWKQAKYEDHKCEICEQYGAIVETYCRHYFHLECFKKGIGGKEITGQCLSCDEISKRYRFWCGDCHERYIKIGYSQLKTVDKLELYYQESKVLHDDCLKDLYCYAKTDLRLTSSTND